MSQSIIIHIGAHKTGTTSIQTLLWHNRRILAARGVLYPEACVYHVAQHRLFFALKGGDRRLMGSDQATELAALDAEMRASDCSRVIISSEGFFSLPRVAIEPVAEALRGHDVKVVAILRRPDHLFESIYNQKVKSVSNRFMAPHRSFLADPLGFDPDMRFDRALDNWAAVFGEAAIDVRCYEDDSDVVNLLCDAFGINLDGLVRPRNRSNPSRSVLAAELIRLGKQHGCDAEAMDALAEVGKRRFPRSAEVGTLLSPEERMAILRASDSMTDIVFARYLKRGNIYRSDRMPVESFPPQAQIPENLVRELFGGR